MVTNKRSTISLALASILVLALGLVLPAIASSSASSQNVESEKLPNELPETEYQALVQAVLNDKSVQEYTNGTQFKVMSYDFIGNTNDSPFVWHPELHISINNGTKQLTVVTDRGTNPSEYAVKYVKLFDQDGPVQATGTGSGNGHAINYYTGTSTISGIRMSTTAPSVLTTANKGMAFMLNGEVVTSNTSQDCSGSTQGGSTYFAQAGFQWGTTLSKVAWADTITSCFPQYPAITYSPGKSYDMKIFSAGSPTQWYIYIKNLYTGEVMTQPRGGVTSSFLKTSAYNTSVFLESQSHTLDGSQFITYPSATSTISTNSGSTWFNWESGKRNDQNCNGVDHIYPYDSTKEVISGNLAGGTSATFNTVRMATNYPAAPC
ncbi:MAG: hypothetical protein ABI347_11535 [Nitrososphaera sp.]|jgi:hypothetical protein